MELFVTSVIIILLFLLSARQLVYASRVMENPNVKAKLSPYVLISSAFFLFTECVGDSVTLERVVLGLTLALDSVLVLSFTLADDRHARIGAFSVIGIEMLLSVLNVVSMGVPDLPSDTFDTAVRWMLLVSVSSAALMYVYTIAYRFRDVKYVMRMGASWSTVCICMDSIYVVCYLTASCVFIAEGMMLAYAIWVSAMLAAVCVRLRKASAFVLWTEQENRIIESMRISQLETFNDSPGVDILYKDIYDRVLEYFESNRPYLNNDLTINDVVAVVFANKLYISKAISHYTGRNFCQFVNYHRVCHAVEIFREDTSLKIVEMANKSGFNSAVSFSTSFRLFMGEKPGDWCRKERVRLSKQKK